MNKLTNPLVIVANGTYPTHYVPLKILKEASSILACDGAANSLIENKFVPDLIIGDMDSISKINKNKFDDRLIIIKDQSQNDLRKAINYAKDNNINNISIIGATGKREDHMIGNIFSIQDYNELDIKIYTDNGIFTCIHKSQKVESFIGQQVSLFSTDPTIKITSYNLMYNFNRSSITHLYRGTSNECTNNQFELKISHGSITIFQQY